jgi:hypothetical protein
VNTLEVAKLFRMARAAFPAQKFDEHTPDLWAEIFAQIQFADARAALVKLPTLHEWLTVKDLLFEIKKLRGTRIDREMAQIQPPPDLDPDDEPSYRRWLAATRQALGDGDPPPDQPALQKRDVRQLMAGGFRRLDDYAGPQVSDEDRKQEQR